MSKKISMAAMEPRYHQIDGRPFPMQSITNTPLLLDDGAQSDDFKSCAAHCVAFVATSLVAKLSTFNAYISVNEQEKMQFACEGMCLSDLNSTSYMLSVRLE